MNSGTKSNRSSACGKSTRRAAALFVLSFAAVCLCGKLAGQDPSVRYRIENGVRTQIVPDSSSFASDSLAQLPDTLPSSPAESDTLPSPREKRRQARLERDTVTVRYSKLFRDTLPISRVCALSAVAPGFGQLYNKQAWKIPILYGTVATTAYFGFQQNGKYRDCKRQYDALKRQNASQTELDPIQSDMIKYNTGRSLLFIGAIASYIYFIGDAALNYQGEVNSVKKATTLSTICPGAGQIYTRSYWKMPIILGGMATMGFVIDFNNRGYERFKLAYDLVTDDNPETVDEFNGRYSAEYLRKMKNNYRRNRDLCIIITAGLYLLNIVDAHVDAHLKDYDISDDLAMTLEPTIVNMYTMRSSNVRGVGLSFKVNF